MGKSMPVKRYIYNGFFVRTLDGITNFTASFVKWTNDPGVAVCKCSDGKQRNIPTCALSGFSSKNVNKQTYEGGKIIYGTPSQEL